MPYPSLLILDQDENVRQTLATILQQSGYQVTCARQASEALEYLEKIRFDLLCLDILFSNVDMHTLQSQIYCRAPRLPVLVITAYPGVAAFIQTAGCKNWCYLLKPIDPHLLLECIARMLAKEVYP